MRLFHNNSRWLLIAALGMTLALSACGGGGAGGSSSAGAGGSSNGSSPGAATPVANAGLDRSVITATLVTLNASGSADPDGDLLTYSWSLKKPNGSSATLSQTTSLTPTFTADVDGTYQATLVVSDGLHVSASDTVVITAAALSLPVGSKVVSVDMVERSGSASGDVPVTFAQAFKAGDVPAGATLAARLTNGVALPLQVDAKATHADGSLRHAVLTTRVPSLSANETATMELVSASPGDAAAGIALSDLITTAYDAEISLNEGGVVYRASARELLLGATPKTWLSGPLVTEWVVAAPVKTTAGVAHPHLSVRFNVRAYAGMDSVRTDVVVENDWALEPSPRNFNYDVTLKVGGATVYTRSALTHYNHARWRKIFWWGKEPQILVKHDKAYLIGTGAIPNYDTKIAVPEATLVASAAEWAASNTSPMGSGFADPDMPGTGSRRDLGVLPQWSVRHLLSQDAREKVSTLGNGDLAGSWPIHYRDRNTDHPISIVDYPKATIQDDKTFPVCGSCSTPYYPDTAHQPSFAYYPYLITGDQYYLEELQFWATWNLLRPNADGSRQLDKGLIISGQVRAQAWDMRTIAQAAYITPDADSVFKSYISKILNNNISWFTSEYPNNPGAPALKFLANGCCAPDPDEGNTIAPWMDDFFTIVMGYLVDMGFTQAQPMRDWKAGFIVGRFSSDPAAFCKYDGADYRYLAIDPSTGGLVSTWTRLTELNHPTHVGGNCPSTFNTYLESEDGYIAHARGALSVAVDVGYSGLKAEIDNIISIQNSAGANYNDDPTWALLPRTR